MDKYIFFTLCNAVGAALTIVVFYPVFKVKTASDLNAALNTPPMLAKAVSSNNSQSRNCGYIYLSIALAAYALIAIGNDVEVDIELAMAALVILFSITFARAQSLRKPLAKP